MFHSDLIILTVEIGVSLLVSFELPKERWVMLEMHEDNNVNLQQIAGQNAF